MKLPFVPQICQLGIIKSTFELQLSATLGLWIVFFLELEHPYKQQNNIMSPLGLNSITNEYTNSLSNCTCCFPLETQSTSFNSAFLDILDGNSNSNHWKNQTLSIQKCFQKGFKKCFKNTTSISKCF